MRKIRREVTRKNPEDFRTADYADATDWRAAGAATWIRLASDTDALQLSAHLQQRGRTLPDLSEWLRPECSN